MNKKILALVLALVVTLSVGSTIAYLQDTDSDVNVMTLGSVYIEQHEQQLAADGVTLEKFEQAKEFYPGSTLSKIVTVENTGKSEAYFRTLIAFESIKSETFEINFPISEDYKWSWGAPAAIIDLDGVTYEVYEALYTKALPAGETSPASLTKVELAATATNEDMEALGGTYEILVLSQAVQTAGFSDAETALNTAFGLTSEKAAEWFGGIQVGTVVSTAEELASALAANKNAILSKDITVTKDMILTKPASINLNGHTLTVSKLEAQANTTISNGTLNQGKNTYPAISVSAGVMTLNNVDVICNEPCNVVLNTSGTQEAAEFVGVQVWDGEMILNDSTITVSTDKLRYSNTVIAIGINGGKMTMNGGAITINNHGSTKPQYDYQGVIFASGNTEKSVTMNNVAIADEVAARYLYAWGGHITLTTTNAVTAANVNTAYGGTYTLK